MSAILAGNAWGEIVHHESDGILELRWLPTAMTDGAFKATLALFAWEAERARPSFLLIDATEFRHQFGPGEIQIDNGIRTKRVRPARGATWHASQSKCHAGETFWTKTFRRTRGQCCATFWT